MTTAIYSYIFILVILAVNILVKKQFFNILMTGLSISMLLTFYESKFVVANGIITALILSCFLKMHEISKSEKKEKRARKEDSITERISRRGKLFS